MLANNSDVNPDILLGGIVSIDTFSNKFSLPSVIHTVVDALPR